MKETNAILFFCICTMLSFVSCKSADITAEKADVSSQETEKVNTQTQKVIVPPKQSNPFARFFLGGQQDIDMAVTQIFQLTVLNALKQEDAVVIYNVESGKAGFNAMYQTSWYHLLFDNTTRAAFSAASAQYLSDFEQKKLDRKNKKSYRIYGEYPVTIQWGTIPRMTSGTADTDVQFGYEFKKKAPYFSITVWPAANQKYIDGPSAVEKSSTLHFYMTKAQVTQMVELLSDAKISEALAPYTENDDENQQKDEY